ncbi:hypothetical protein ACFQ07_04985, partial [Actinomadura adrarensis]
AAVAVAAAAIAAALRILDKRMAGGRVLEGRIPDEREFAWKSLRRSMRYSCGRGKQHFGVAGDDWVAKRAQLVVVSERTSARKT